MNFIQKQKIKNELSKLKVKDLNDLISLIKLELIRRDKLLRK